MLTDKEVNDVFMACLFQEGEDHSDYILADGITTKVGFHPTRISEHSEQISSLLDELPDGFKSSSGGGWSFLNACHDRHGNQWTGLHQRMEQLFQLGIAIGRVRSVLPREMWSALPGGVPYYVVIDESVPVENTDAGGE